MTKTLLFEHSLAANSLMLAVKEFKETGDLSSNTLEELLGKAPAIPNSPEISLNLRALDKVAEYRQKVLEIKEVVKSLSASN